MRKNRKRKNTLPFLVVNPNLPQGKNRRQKDERQAH